MPAALPPDDLLALAVQQPWAELILRGVKTLEVRSTGTRVRGSIYLYASRRPSSLPDARPAVDRFGLNLDDLPHGVVVGTMSILEARSAVAADAAAACVSPGLLQNRFVWRLGSVARFSLPLSVQAIPYGIWFRPFRRRG